MRTPALLAALLLCLVADAQASDYTSARSDLEAERVRLAAALQAEDADRDAVRGEARRLLTRAVRHELLPAWFGTPWAFEGISATPGEGEIACGYLVSTVSQHAGLKVQRYKLAQRGSEDIARSFAPDGEVRTLRSVEPAQVAKHVSDRGEGIYVVGLSFHVGFLVVEGETVEFCHSAYYGTTGVVCEPAATSQGIADSDVFVIAPYLSDRTVDAWLGGERIATHGL